MIIHRISLARKTPAATRGSYVAANDDKKVSEPWDIDPQAPYQWIQLATEALGRQEVQLAEHLIEMAYRAADGIIERCLPPSGSYPTKKNLRSTPKRLLKAIR